MKYAIFRPFNVSQTIVDGDMRRETKDDPHVHELLLLRKKQPKRRQGRIFSIFSLVRFKNTACVPSGTKNTYTGTCYLSTECTEKVKTKYNITYQNNCQYFVQEGQVLQGREGRGGGSSPFPKANITCLGKFIKVYLVEEHI